MTSDLFLENLPALIDGNCWCRFTKADGDTFIGVPATLNDRNFKAVTIRSHGRVHSLVSVDLRVEELIKVERL